MNAAQTYASAGLGSSAGVVLAWLLGAMFHVPMPPEVAVAAGGLLVACVGAWMHRNDFHNSRGQVPEARGSTQPANTEQTK